MSGEAPLADELDLYLQFTPLTSAAPLRSIVDSFVVPRAVSVLSPASREIQTDLINLDNQQAFANILSHSHELRTDIKFRDTFAQRSTAAALSRGGNTVVADLQTLLQSYREQIASSVLDSSGHTEPLQHNFPPPINLQGPSVISQIAPANTTTDRIAIPPPKHQLQSPSTKEDPHIACSPSKRPSSCLGRFDTPSKHKKQRKSNPVTPIKSTVNDDSPLQANLKTQNAVVAAQIQTLIEDIFEAEDSLEDDTSNTASNTFFVIHGLQKSLTSESIQRLFGVFKKVSQTEALNLLDKESLLRLHRIVLRSVDTSDVASSHELEDRLGDMKAQQEWINMIQTATDAVTSALCSIHISEAFPPDHELYSEETFFLIIDSLKTVLDELYFRWFLDTSQLRTNNLEKHKTLLDFLLQAAISLLERLSTTFVELEMPETIVSRMIFMAVGIIFVETPGRQSRICSHLIIESLKSSAVTTLQRIFAKVHDQRLFILDEILMCLNKLPSDRQSARQFKLGNGKSIQLVSALLLHLVHASSATITSWEFRPADNDIQDASGIEDNPAQSSGDSGMSAAVRGYLRRYATAEQVGRHIINFILEKSMKSSKAITTEDAPFKALLDVFIEDFIAVLDMPEWPAAELMLRWITNYMLKLVDDPKAVAQVKVCAVDALCSIACKIKLSCSTISQAVSVDNSDNLPTFDFSSATTVEQLQRLQQTQDDIACYLVECAKQDSSHRASLQFSISFWIHFMTKPMSQKTELGSAGTLLSTATERLAHSYGTTEVDDRASLIGTSMTLVSLPERYMKLMTFSGLFHMFEVILPRLLNMMTHVQITLRTKTLRSFGRLSEIDSTILSLKPVQSQIAMRMSDSSPQVRDVAIDLLGKHISANPQAGSQYYPVLRDRIRDTGLSVRKRVLRLCKELYVKNNDVMMQIDIARQFLGRMHDEEDSIQELVLKSIESMWFSPSGSDTFVRGVDAGQLSIHEAQKFHSQAVVISTIASDQDEHMSEALKHSLVKLHDNKIPDRTDVVDSFRLYVQIFSTDILNQAEDEPRLKGLVALKTFAQAVPGVFSASQVQSFLPYLQFGPWKFEQHAPSHVASIYVAVLPQLKTVDSNFLKSVQSSLLAQLTKFPLKSLNEIVPCLCIVVHLRGDFFRAATTLKSCLSRLINLSATQGGISVGLEKQIEKQIILLLHLVGLFGRHLKLSDPLVLKETFGATLESELTSKLLSATMQHCHVETATKLSAVEKTALRSLGNICIGNPDYFQDKKILAYMDRIIANDNSEARKILIGIYVDYLNVEQRRTDDLKWLAGKDDKNKEHKNNTGRRLKKGETAGNGIDVGVLTGNTDKFATDGISPALMQRYLARVLQFSLGQDLSLAVVATNLISNIVTQGLANPRNCMPTIIALECSTEPRLRTVAAQMHRSLYEKHESLIESCYGDGIQAAFHYCLRSRKIKSASTDKAPLTVLYSIVKVSRKARRKFLTTFAKKLDTDLDKIESLTQNDLLYALFIAQNAVCLDYATNEEVHVVVYAIDQILATTGTSLLQMLDEQGSVAQLGIAAAILCLCIKVRTQLKDVYGLTESRCAAFDPAKLGSKSDIKVTMKKDNISLVPNWGVIHATTDDRIEAFKLLFDKAENRYLEDRTPSPAVNLDEDITVDPAFTHVAPKVGILESHETGL